MVLPNLAGNVALCSGWFLEVKTKLWQSNLGEKDSLQLKSCSPLREVKEAIQEGTCRQELKQPRGGTLPAGFLPLACSASFPEQPRLACSGMGLPTVAWALPHQLAIKRTPPRHGHRPTFWRPFLNGGTHFLNVSSWQLVLTMTLYTFLIWLKSTFNSVQCQRYHSTNFKLSLGKADISLPACYYRNNDKR